MSKLKSNLAQRLISSAVLLPTALFLMFKGGWWFFTLILVVMTLATWEYVHMLRHHGYLAEYAFALPMLWAILLDFCFPDGHYLQPALAILLLLSLAWHVLGDRTPTKVENWLMPLSGTLYIGWTAGHMLRLRALPRGGYLLFLAFGVTWLADSAAYFVGRAWGKHHMAPRLSPKKTWEGFAAGVVVATIGGAIIAGLGNLSWIKGGVLGFLAATITPLGDLGISMIKREVGVKDSSNLIPGHGGMLDRVDSLLTASIIGYYYVIWIMGIQPT